MRRCSLRDWAGSGSRPGCGGPHRTGYEVRGRCRNDQDEEAGGHQQVCTLYLSTGKAQPRKIRNKGRIAENH